MADSPLRPRSSYIPPTGVDPLRPSGDLFFEEDLVRATLPETADARRGLAQAFAAAASGHHSGAALKAAAAGDAALEQQALRQAELADRQAELYAPRVSSLRDAQSIGDVGSFIAGAAPGVVADTLPALGAALLTRGRWKPAAFAGATVPSYHQQFGEMAREQRLDPTLSEASAEDRLRSARLGAGGGALLEALLPGKLANEALRGPSRSLLRNTAVDALTEGVTETAQTGVQHLAHRTIDPTRELDGWDLADAAVGGAAGGGGLGAASRAPSHVANALLGRAQPVQNDAGDPQPGADAAPPGTPLLPAPDDGSGGGVGGLYDTLNERFGDGIRDRAQKTKDYVSDTIDRMGEAAKTAATPQDFLQQVFGNISTEDAAAADLRPDTEDPSVLNAADPAAALQQRDAQRQERAALFAAELLNDPATPESVKERVASFGGDFSNPEAQAFVARNLVAQRAGEKLANAVSDLFDLTKDFGGKAAETGTDLASKARDMIDKGMEAARDRIVKKNLQGINEADVAPLVRLLAQRLGPTLAGDAPKLARQLVAAANRLSPDARITEETDRRLRNLSTAVDDEVLDLVTELSGSDALRNTIAKIRSIPSAASDVRQSGGHSFLESMLKQPLEPAVLSQLSEFVDTLGLQLGSMPSERKNQVLAGLALAFGSKREAQTVVEYYGNIRRDAFRLEAEADTLADDRPLDDDAPGEVVATLENPDGTVSYGAEFGSLTEQDAAEMTASYRDPNPARPFFRATDRAALRDARRAAPPGSRVATLREYVAQTGENPKAVAARVRQDLRKRLTDAENRDTATVQEAIASMEAVPEAERSEDFNTLLSQLKARKTENRTDLPGLRKQMEAIEKASGVSFKEIADLSRRIRRAELADEGGVDNSDIANLPALRKQLAKLEDRYAKNAERVLERYAVVMRPKDETFANDELMAKFRGLLDRLPNANVGTDAERAKKREAIAKIKKTAIKFYRKGRKTPITLSAESMAYASQARGSMEERFLDSLAAVLARPDIEGMETPAADTLISRRSGLTWGDIAPEQLEDTRTDKQKERARKAAQDKAATKEWAKQERMRADIETRPKLMAALRDVQRRFLADRLGLTLAPDETFSLTDLIDRFPPSTRGAMRTDANEAAFQSALGWAKKLSRKLATASDRNYADESRMRVLEKYIDEQLDDRFPMPEGDERASRRIDAENQAAGVRVDEGGIGGAILDAEAEIDMLEERLDAVEGIDGLTRKYERRVEEAQTELDRLADSVGSPEQRDARVPGPRQDPRDAGRTDRQPPKPGKGPAKTEVRSAKGGTETVMTVRAAIRSLFNTALDNVVVVRRTAKQLFDAAGIDPAKLPAGVLFSYSDTQKSADASVRDFATYINTKLDADGLPYISKETRTDDDVNAIATKFLDAVKKDPRLLINPVNSEKLSVSQYLTDEETGEAIDPNDLSQHWRLTDIGRHVASAIASGRISGILAEEATRITEGRDSAIVDLIRVLDESGIGTPVERARVVIAASKYATSGTYSPTSGEVRVRANGIGDNRHGVTVNEAIAKEVIKELRAGKGMKAAMKAATVTSVEAARRSNEHASTTGWVEFKKGSSPEALNKAMNGTGWCTGFTDTSYAATQISQGSFWAYYEDGEPQIGIRTEDGRLGEPPRGRLEGQRLPPKYAGIAADFLKKGGKVTGGEEFLQERQKKLAVREILAAKGELSPEQFRNAVMVTVGRDGEATFGVANGKAYGAENVVFPESRIPPQFRGVIGAMENAAVVSFNGASLPSGVRVVRGSLLSDTLTSAPSLEQVGGSLLTYNLESAPELREVRGELHAFNLTSAPSLEQVGGHMYVPGLKSARKLERVGSSLRAEALESAPELREVSGHLDADALTSAPKLERVGRDLRADSLTSAPKLELVGTDMYVGALTSAPELREVGEGVYAANLMSAPKLREVGGSMYVDALESVPELREVGGSMFVNALESVPELRKVGGDLQAPTLTSAPKLERVGTDMYVDALESAPELREVGGVLYGYALKHAPKLSVPLHELRNRDSYDQFDDIPFSRDASGNVQGFVYEKKAYLAADNIERNRARGVLMHELGEHLGDLRGLLGDANYDKLFKAVEGWANSVGKEGEIAKAAIRRAKESGNYETELLAYAIEEAVNAGVKPTAEGVVGKWLEAVMNAFKAALKRLTGADMNLTAQDLVDLAHGAALRGPIREMRAESRGQDPGTRTPRNAPKSSQGKVVKKSFVGAKADPQGAADAEGLLRVGAPADVVWRELGWFRGPDGKLRKEIRSPVLRRRVRELADDIINGTAEPTTIGALLEGIDAFKPYLDKLGNVPVRPNDMMVEMMGAVGAYGEDGLGLSRLNAMLAARVEAIPDGKGHEVLREIVRDLVPEELRDSGFNEPDVRDVLAELHRRDPLPDIDERVVDLLSGTIIHELQHAFQHVEGFDNGGNPTTAVVAMYGDPDEFIAAVRDEDHETVEQIISQAFAQFRAEVGPDLSLDDAAYALYESIVGEVEANDVMARMKLDDAEARAVAPALADAKRGFVRSVLLAEALSAVRGMHSATSKVGGRPGRPGKNWGDKAAVKAEILRLRGKDVKVRIEKLVKQLGGSGQYTYDRATGERLIEVAINAASPLGTARHEAMHDLFRFLSKDPATRSIAKDLRDATSAPHVIKQLRELLKDHKGALEQLSDPEERAAYAYQFWAEGQLRIGPTGTGVFQTIRKFLRDLFGVVTAGQRGEDLMRAFHDGKFADPSTVQEVLQDLNDANGDRLRNKMERAAPALVKATRAVFTPAVDRLRSFEDDSLNELADKFFSDTGRSGFIQNKFQQEGVWRNRLAALLDGTTAAERRAAVDQLQAMAPKSPLAKALAKYNKDIYEYMRDAGVKSWDSQKKAFVPLREVQNYFTRSWDADAIARNRAEFEALLRKEGGVSATNAAALADNLARGTEARPGPKEEGVDLGYMPYAPHTSERVLTFINQSNAQAFAKFQHKDLADIMTMYTRSAVHRAEYAREFGNNGERIVALVKSSGVRGKDAMAEISNSVQALEGSLDPGKWSPETKQFMAGIQTLQNVVILPLALASQMIDPIVLAARSGDIRDAGRAYATALLRLKNTITKSSDGVVGEDLANILGIVSEDSTLQAMAMAYGTTRMSKRMEAVNRVFFRYNGMQGWNDSMRIAATAAGERYLLANKRNAAALAELDLTSKDIKVDKNGRLDVSSPKVQQAMFRFVDQAVLRPSSAQRPVWMSDPRFLLVAHLKQFTFAMHNVVLKRANRELSAGNPKPWATLMLAMPVMLAADMAKFALTGSAPSTWGFKDYLVHAVERSGLLGLGDFGVQAMSGVGMGKMPGEELLGPSFEHLMELLRWIGGDPRTGFGDVIDRTVPGARFV